MLDFTLYLRFFNAVGTPLGREMPIATGEDIDRPHSMAFDPAGNLLLLWGVYDPDLRLQLFDRRGRPLGPPVGVSSEASDPSDFEEPLGGSVAWAGDSWLVTWEGAPFPFDFTTIFVRRFTLKAYPGLQSQSSRAQPGRQRGEGRERRWGGSTPDAWLFAGPCSQCRISFPWTAYDLRIRLKHAAARGLNLSSSKGIAPRKTPCRKAAENPRQPRGLCDRISSV
jgi:hypothetical protein